MNKIYALVTFMFAVDFCTATSNKVILREMKKTINSWGFNVEEHEVETEDGYLLTTFRIHKFNQKQFSKPIVFGHGMYGKSENFMALAKASVTHFLAQRGYDVWLMNARGSQYSIKHKTFNPYRDNDYWKFTWHEIGYYDIPANIDYILNVTQNKNIFYCGHSQGGTAFYVLASSRPEYNKKIRAAVNLAPGIFKGNKEHTMLTLAAQHYRLVQILVESLQYYQLFPDVVTGSEISHHICKISYEMSRLCLMLGGIAVGRYMSLINPSRVPYALLRSFGGGSTLQVIHYLQNVNSAEFRQYDHGLKGNMAVYKQPTPPDYDIQKVTAPSLNFYAFDDIYAPKMPIENLINTIPSAKGHLLEDKRFTHFDFIFAENSSTLIHQPMYEYMESFN